MADVTKELLGLGIGLVVLVIALAFGADVTSDIGSGFAAGTVARNITDEGQNGLKELGLKVDTIAVIGAISVILFMIIRIGVMARQ